MHNILVSEARKVGCLTAFFISIFLPFHIDRKGILCATSLAVRVELALIMSRNYELALTL